MIYIVANACATSGGPELLHQLCYYLNHNGFEASMVYYRKLRFPTNGPEKTILEKYGRYECPYSTKIDDSDQNIVILPEIVTFFLPKLKKSKIVIWWLSVDNYFLSLKSKYAKFYAPFGMNRNKFNPFRNEFVHCVQSEYARLFLIEQGVKGQNIHPLSDYLSEEFIKQTQNESSEDKSDTIAYNPMKGYEFTKKIIAAYNNIKWIPIQNMSRSEIVDTLVHAKVYIDFGNHPGKDRIPREAAMCGCCIVTSLDGAAKNDIDIPISNSYKFKANEDEIPAIIIKLKYIIQNYKICRNDFEEYRCIIKNEESIFKTEMFNVFNMLSNRKE